MLRYLRTEPYYLGDSAHEIFIDDFLWRFGAELHRFNNPGGVPYSAIYRYGEEEMSCERQGEDQMIKSFRERIYSEVTGGRRNRQWVR